MLNAAAQEVKAVCAVVAGGALVELLNVDGVLKSAVLDKGAVGDMGKVLGQAHDESEADFGVRVQLARAELDDVAQALGRAVLATHAVVTVETERWLDDAFIVHQKAKRVDLVVYLLHGRKEKLSQSILVAEKENKLEDGHGSAILEEATLTHSRIRAFADDVSLQRHLAATAHRLGGGRGSLSRQLVEAAADVDVVAGQEAVADEDEDEDGQPEAGASSADGGGGHVGGGRGPMAVVQR
ncbi:hypothetical protein IF1G_02911 [Cordyceps javanica]|uniref:Uncharacterized protein n=1 Tax=Cordyceps javanica TaxID=43265 RepID=A0A545VAS3_9HYPO|nr:hypothetical protein IF1G_02911 [Cordyceps javanica]TQW10041.1 hypothetical protein IF2G_02831 [Cordyceps javanica]